MKIPTRPPPRHELLEKVLKGDGGAQLLTKMAGSAYGPTVAGKYRHWDVLRHLQPPDGLTLEQWWLGIKLSRQSIYQQLPMRDKHARPFVYALPDIALRMLHLIDRNASGAIQAADQVTNPQTRDTYLMKSIVEEAITSSQLEGASTTREVAKEMIKRGREPMDRSERMIFNNYRALLYTRQMMKQPLTPDRIFELHRILTADTLDDPSAAGRLRTAEEHICVSDEQGTMLHDPPNAAELSERLSAMCTFANATESDPFIHPVVRAILLHFWLAYDHPFVDGNGRTARALFYWSMVRQGYWLAEFLSISRIIRQAPGRYGRSFLYTETDDNDATYFILAQMSIIVRAIDELHSYLARKAAELRATAQLIRQSDVIRDFLNHRQLSLVNHALKHPGWQYTIESHRNSHDVAYGTARSDLFELAEQGLVVQGKVGRMYTFLAPGDLQERLTALSNKRAATLASQ